MSQSDVFCHLLLTQEITKNVIQTFDGTAFQFWSWIKQYPVQNFSFKCDLNRSFSYIVK